jgi:hypothetical protein
LRGKFPRRKRPVLDFKPPQEGREMGSSRDLFEMYQQAQERTGDMNESTKRAIFGPAENDVVEIPITLTQYLEAKPSKTFQEQINEDPHFERPPVQGSVKTLKDVISELLVIMAEVGNVDVLVGAGACEGIPHIEYAEDTDTVEIL